MDKSLITIEVAYARPEHQILKSLRVPAQTTIRAALIQSDILETCPEINLACVPVGIFSEIKTLDDLVTEGDRIEIYRPLKLDPKERRKSATL